MVIKHNKIINKSLKSQNNVILLFKCTKNTKSINTRVSKTNNGKTVILSKCGICGSKKELLLLKKKNQVEY